jgi:hypothetical protein
VQILANRIGPYVRAEMIDIKERTTGNIIEDNIFDGKGECPLSRVAQLAAHMAPLTLLNDIEL